MDMGPDLQLVNNTGLKTEQNICFVNITVQLLKSIPSIQAYFKERCYKLEMTGSKKTDICDEIADIFISSGKKYCSAAKLRNLVALNSGRSYLSDGSHQDAIEFLMTLLQLVKSETSYQSNGIVDGLFGLEKLEKNFVLGLYGKCKKCSKKPRDEVEEFSVFELEVPASNRNILLQHLLDTSLHESTNDSEMKCDCCTHTYNCLLQGDCKPKQISAKRSILQEPQVLFIQLKRFSGAFSNVWPDDKITLPSSASYELCGIGHHLGQSNTSGHYIASVKKKTEFGIDAMTQRFP